MKDNNIRWLQRLQNFSRACTLLAEIKGYEHQNTLAIICEGFIQRFEFAFDLAWKTLRDFLEYEGLQLQPTPHVVIKEAFATVVLDNAQVFLDMLQARNLTSHMHDKDTFDIVFLQIQNTFYPALQILCDLLQERAK